MKISVLGRALARTIAVAGVAAAVLACSDGDSLSVAAPPAATTPDPVGPTWTQGVYAPASDFKDLCEAPRVGVDIEGYPYPDVQGALIDELFWLRSWTHETYLWNDEVVDRNPADYDDRLEYFDVLRTTELTPSGRDKDDFHFSEPTEEYLERRNAAPEATYGATFLAYSTTPPRDYRVAFTQPGSPAAQSVMGQINLPRGTRILEVDGVDLVNGGATDAELDILNNGLFPANAGEQHDFVVQDAGSAAPRSVTLTAVDIAEQPVNTTAVIDTPTGPVGYLLTTTFGSYDAEADLAAAIADFRTAGVSDLVLDLRYNGGGLLMVAAQLGYMIAGEARTSGRVFEALRFNDDAGNLNPVTGEVNEPLPFYNAGIGYSLPEGAVISSLDLGRVYVLATEWTCSASESVINALRGVDVEVVLIGDVTCGKPYGFYPTDNCGETYYTVQFQGVNDKGFGDYADGFAPANATAPYAVTAPGCSVADDLDHPLGDAGEALLAAALQYRDDGSCPAATGGASPKTSAPSTKSAAARATRDPAALRPVMARNRDLTPPKE